MAALDRPTEATYAIHEKVTVDTTDREDHTFCGIMFPIKCKNILPIDHIVINSISVRGRLGPLTVWVTKDPLSEDAVPSHLDEGGSSEQTSSLEAPPRRSPRWATARPSTVSKSRSFSMKQRHWNKIYEKTHTPSFREYRELDLSSNVIILKPGQVRAVYIHSTLPGDEALVYDNKQKSKTHDDGFITILPGRAHVSTDAFGTSPIWGWGNAWRDNREFVGRISYGAVYRLWNPKEHFAFGSKFQRLVTTLFACQRRFESPLSRLPDDCIFYILNMCRWDWVDDSAEGITNVRRKKKMLLRQQQQQNSGAAADSGAVDDSDNEQKMEAASSCSHSCSATRHTHEYDDGDSNEDEEDAESDMYEYEEDDSHSNESDESDEGDYSDWEEDDNEDTTFFYYDDDAESSDGGGEESATLRDEQQSRSWLRSQFARIHVLRALTSVNDATSVRDATGMDIDS